MRISDHKLSAAQSRGYITLLSVLVVGAVGVAIALSLITLGLGSGRTSLAYQQMHQAKAMASACAEEALEKIRETAILVGTGGGLTLGGNTCTYVIVTGAGENRTINTTGTVGTVVRKISVSITAINPLIVVSTWQEIP